MTLTATQLTDIQADIGIGSDESVFTDTELNRLFARADSDYSLAVFYAVRQLLMNAARYYEHEGADTKEKKQQVFDHLKEMYELWGAATGGLAPLVAGTIELDFIEPTSVTEYS